LVIIDNETKYNLGTVSIGEKRADEYGEPTYDGEGFLLTIYDNTVAYVHTHALHKVFHIKLICDLITEIKIKIGYTKDTIK